MYIFLFVLSNMRNYTIQIKFILCKYEIIQNEWNLYNTNEKLYNINKSFTIQIRNYTIQMKIRQYK